MANTILDNVTINQPVANLTALAAIPTSLLNPGTEVLVNNLKIFYIWSGSAWTFSGVFPAVANLTALNAIVTTGFTNQVTCLRLDNSTIYNWNGTAWVAVSAGTVTQVNSGTGLTGGPITTSGTLALSNTAVTAGSYTNPNITVNAQGQLTAATNGSASGTVTSVGVSSSTLTLSGTNPVTSAGTIGIDLPNTAVTPGTFANANITVDAKGRLTAASGGGLGTAALKTATNNSLSDVTSVIGPTTIGHIAVFADTTGTIQDGGSPSGGAPTDATYILQTANPSLPNAQVLGVSDTGLVKNTASTGVLSIANSADVFSAGQFNPTGLTIVGASGNTDISNTASQIITINTTNSDSTYTLPAQNLTQTQVAAWEITNTGSVAIDILNFVSSNLITIQPNECWGLFNTNFSIPEGDWITFKKSGTGSGGGVTSVELSNLANMNITPTGAQTGVTSFDLEAVGGVLTGFILNADITLSGTPGIGGAFHLKASGSQPHSPLLCKLANQTGANVTRSVFFISIDPASNNFFALQDNTGGAVLDFNNNPITMNPGETWAVYNADYTSAAGNWLGYLLVGDLSGFGTAAFKAATDNTFADVASVVGPISIGNIATFYDTIGTIQDGGPLGDAAAKGVTDDTQPDVVSIDTFIPPAINEAAIFADVNGTIKTSGLMLGLAAQKGVTDNSLNDVPTVIGPTVIGHVATFADTSGTIQDGGSAAPIPSFTGVAYNTAGTLTAATSDQITDAALINPGSALHLGPPSTDIVLSATDPQTLVLGKTITPQNVLMPDPSGSAYGEGRPYTLMVRQNDGNPTDIFQPLSLQDYLGNPIIGFDTNPVVMQPGDTWIVFYEIGSAIDRAYLLASSQFLAVIATPPTPPINSTIVYLDTDGLTLRYRRSDAVDYPLNNVGTYTAKVTANGSGAFTAFDYPISYAIANGFITYYFPEWAISFVTANTLIRITAGDGTSPLPSFLWPAQINFIYTLQSTNPSLTVPAPVLFELREDGNFFLYKDTTLSPFPSGDPLNFGGLGYTTLVA